MIMSLFNFVRHLELGNMYCSKCDAITALEVSDQSERTVCTGCNKQLLSNVSDALYLSQIDIND